jgi:hypothetical protein
MDQPASPSAAGPGPSEPKKTGPRLLPPCTGVTPPQLAEGLIRETRPSVLAGGPALPGLARTLMRSVVLAPLGWLLLAPLFAKKIAPFICRRYTLTNQRLMIQRGLKPRPVDAVPLAEIDDVRLEPGSYDPFYRSGNLEVLSQGKVRLRLPGVPEPEGFRHAVLNACAAWVPDRARLVGPFLPASGKE